MLTQTGVQAVCYSTNEWTKLGERQSVFLSPLIFFLPFTVSVICCVGSITDTQAILIMERDATAKHWCTFAF